MKILSTNTNFGPLKFFGPKFHDGHDFLIATNGSPNKLDYLVFLDSRGISEKYEGSVAESITKAISGSGFLVVCRPLEITTWATFRNFMVLNNFVQPKVVITNLGGSDFMPKNLPTTRDTICQAEFALDGAKCGCRLIEKHMSSTGELIDLYIVDYPAAYREELRRMLAKLYCIAIKSPRLRKETEFSRKRPESFYVQLERSNTFIDSLGCAKVIELGYFDNTFTYDGVHWTAKGNELVMSKLRAIM